MIDMDLIIKYKSLVICCTPFILGMIAFFIINKLIKNKHLKFSFFTVLFLAIFLQTYQNEFLRMDSPNYYRKYDINRFEKNSKIRSILRKSSAKHHPDTGSGDTDEYLLIRELTEVLLNRSKRTLYDYYNLSIEKIQGFPNNEIKDIEKQYMKFTIMDIVSQNYIFFILSILMIFVLKDYDSGNIGSKLLMIKMAISGYQYALHKVDLFCFSDILFAKSSIHEQQIYMNYLFSFLLALIYIHYILYGTSEKFRFENIENQLSKLNINKNSEEFKECSKELKEIFELFK